VRRLSLVRYCISMILSSWVVKCSLTPHNHICSRQCGASKSTSVFRTAPRQLSAVCKLFIVYSSVWYIAYALWPIRNNKKSQRIWRKREVCRAQKHGFHEDNILSNNRCFNYRNYSANSTLASPSACPRTSRYWILEILASQTYIRRSHTFCSARSSREIW